MYLLFFWDILVLLTQFRPFVLTFLFKSNKIALPYFYEYIEDHISCSTKLRGKICLTSTYSINISLCVHNFSYLSKHIGIHDLMTIKDWWNYIGSFILKALQIRFFFISSFLFFLLRKFKRQNTCIHFFVSFSFISLQNITNIILQ